MRIYPRDSVPTAFDRDYLKCTCYKKDRAPSDAMKSKVEICPVARVKTGVDMHSINNRKSFNVAGAG